jgi:hypothetical protein
VTWTCTLCEAPARFNVIAGTKTWFTCGRHLASVVGSQLEGFVLMVRVEEA